MLTVVIITKNEEQMIGDCLKSVQFADEVVVVDTGNTDRTNEIARRHKARVVASRGSDYSQFRNDGLKAAKGDWILYVDADERVTPELAREVKAVVSRPVTAVAFAIPRRNVFLGRAMKYGGWGGDYVPRLFFRSVLTGWKNPLHEQPVFSGQLEKMTSHFVHHSHRDLSSMLEKTLGFTSHEAQLRIDAHHPPVVWWRFLRVMGTEFWYRFIKLKAARDGTEGIIDGMFQVYNSFVIYARLWELQLPKAKE